MLNDPMKKGFYLATIGHCMECHTPMVKGQHDWTADLARGGTEFPGPWGVSTSRNITVEQDQGHRGVDRRRDQARHHDGHRQGRQQA